MEVVFGDCERVLTTEQSSGSEVLRVGMISSSASRIMDCNFLRRLCAELTETLVNNLTGDMFRRVEKEIIKS